MSEVNKLMEMKKGAVTFLDVLGWKGIWQRRPDAIECLISIINKAKQNKDEQLSENGSAWPEFKRLKTDVISISDTIVILTYGDCENALKHHSLLCDDIIVSSLKTDLLMRGATCYGKFKYANSILAGPAVDEVASWYEQAEWIGVFQTPSAFYISKHESPYDGLFFVDYELPLKSGKKIFTRCTDWPRLWRWRKYTEEDLKNIFLKSIPITPDIYSKFSNSINFYRYSQTEYDKIIKI